MYTNKYVYSNKLQSNLPKAYSKLAKYLRIFLYNCCMHFQVQPAIIMPVHTVERHIFTLEEICSTLRIQLQND